MARKVYSMSADGLPARSAPVGPLFREVDMRALSIGIVACALVTLAASSGLADEPPGARSAETSLEVATGTGLAGGTGISAAIAREIRPWFSATANAEWGQRPWISGGPFPDVDKRLGYLGAGVRLRVFPKERAANYVTMGVGLGRLSFPGSSDRSEWLLVPWTGIGMEARVLGRVHVGTELRFALLRRDGMLEAEGGLPLRVTVRVPLGKEPS